MAVGRMGSNDGSVSIPSNMVNAFKQKNLVNKFRFPDCCSLRPVALHHNLPLRHPPKKVSHISLPKTSKNNNPSVPLAWS